jgi:hypothetical protein
LRVAHDNQEKQALGKRLASARKLAGYTLDSAAVALRAKGYAIVKGTLGAWEVGRNVPDAIWMGRLAKLYNSTVDALLWDDALTMEAVRMAVQYDALSDRERRRLRTLWSALVRSAVEDVEVEKHFPLPPATTPSKQK